MTFLSPWWLFTLVPYGVLIWWMFQRTAVVRQTTAAFLWQPESRLHGARQTHRARPPAWVLVALVALALALLSLARPAIRVSEDEVAVLVDPSYRTFVGGSQSINGIEERVAALVGSRRIRWIVAGQPDVNRLDDVRQTARNTAGMLRGAIAALDREERRLIVVTADAHLVSTNRLVIVRPDNPTEMPTLRVLAARTIGERVHVLTIIDRGTSHNTVDEIVVSAGDNVERRTISWRAGEDSSALRWSFRDPDSAIVRAVLTGSNGQNEIARVTRGNMNVAVEIVGEVDAAVTRFAAAYRQSRGSGRGAHRVTLCLDTMVSDSASILFASRPLDRGAVGTIRVAPLKVIDDVAWDELNLEVIGSLPAGFQPVVWRNDVPVIGLRELPYRQMWIGAQTGLNAESPAWVALLDAAVTWVAGGEASDAWQSTTSEGLPAQGWRPIEQDMPNVAASPGLYQDESGQVHAVNLAQQAPPSAIFGPISGVAEDYFAIDDATWREASSFGWAAVMATFGSATLLCVSSRRLDVRGGAI